MGTICPYCNIEVDESRIEQEDGCCPECGSVITVSSLREGSDEPVFEEDDDYLDDIDDMDDFDDIDDIDDLDDMDDMEDFDDFDDDDDRY